MTIVPLALALALADSGCVHATELRVPIDARHTIAAVLERPPTVSRALTTVLLIGGAGPTGRDYPIAVPGGAVYPAYRLLGHYLVCSGYAVVRFDERGVGQSTGDYRGTATTRTLADDVGSLIAALKRRSEVDSTSILLLGHSEGGTIATLAAIEAKGIAGVVLLAAPALPGTAIMAYQHKYQIVSDWMWPAEYPVSQRIRDLDDQANERTRTEPWYRFFLTYDPLLAYQHLKTPVLVLQGDGDWQVQPSQSVMISEALRRAGNPVVDLVTLTGFDHNFFPLEQYDKPPFLSRELLGVLLAWLNRHAHNRRR